MLLCCVLWLSLWAVRGLKSVMGWRAAAAVPAYPWLTCGNLSVIGNRMLIGNRDTFFPRYDYEGIFVGGAA